MDSDLRRHLLGSALLKRDSAVWLALLVAPLFALADQVVAYAAVDWSCAHQLPATAHVVHATFFVASAMATLPAWLAWRAPPRSGTEKAARIRFVAGVACGSGVFATIVIASMWIPTWLIPACAS